MTRADVIEARISELVARFDRYVEAYDSRVPFSSDQLRAHRKTIELRREAGNLRAAVADDRFIASLRATLEAWGIGRRASRMVPDDAFAAALQAAVPQLEPLESLRIDDADLPGDLTDRLSVLIDGLGVVENRAKLVAGTKTLHHLLPELVPPMDRAWTGLFFQFHLPEWQDPQGQRRIFRIAYDQFVRVARQADPVQHVTSRGWRTSRTKIIDNAIIGFGKVKLSGLTAEDEPASQISFKVAGYPPAKNEATSIFGPGHSHAARVRLLLESARQACAARGFSPVEQTPVSLEVTLRSPAGQVPGDATNYLGGIADVLEHKAHRGPLDHLGDLAAVWLYRNDRQIKEVHYQEIEAGEVSYTVTLRQLPTSPA